MSNGRECLMCGGPRPASLLVCDSCAAGSPQPDKVVTYAVHDRLRFYQAENTRLTRERDKALERGRQWATVEMRQEREAQQHTIDRLRAALEFYANPSNYVAIGFLFDHPCGEFADDFTDDEEFGRPMPGARARAALEGRDA